MNTTAIINNVSFPFTNKKGNEQIIITTTKPIIALVSATNPKGLLSVNPTTLRIAMENYCRLTEGQEDFLIDADITLDLIPYKKGHKFLDKDGKVLKRPNGQDSIAENDGVSVIITDIKLSTEMLRLKMSIDAEARLLITTRNNKSKRNNDPIDTNNAPFGED